MARPELAQLINSLASSGCRVPGRECWPELAPCVLNLGGDWPAAAELAAMDAYDDELVGAAVERLAHQCRADMGDLPPLEHWSAVCAVIARSCRLGLLDALGVTRRFDNLWRNVRDRSPATRGEELLWEGMAVWELGFWAEVDVTDRAAVMITEADELIAQGLIDTEFCRVVVDSSV